MNHVIKRKAFISIKSRQQQHSSYALQRGQVLVFGLFLMIIGAAILFFVFNTGQLVKNKTKLVNTADAAAYSAGLITARTMNAASYVNRAMVANSIAIAQIVSLQSWVDFVSAQGNYITQPNNDILTKTTPGIVDATALNTVKYADYNNAFASATIANYEQFYSKYKDSKFFENNAVISDQKIHFALKNIQLSYFLMLRLAREEIIRDVIKANYENTSTVGFEINPLIDGLGPAFDEEGFQNGLGYFVQTFNDTNRGRLLDVIDAAQKIDGFTNHSAQWAQTAAIPGTCPGKFDFIERRRGTAHRIESELQPGFISVPSDQIGYARWTASDELVENYYDPASGCTLQQRVLAQGNTSWGNDPGQFAGLPPFFDLSQDRQRETDPRLKFGIRLFLDKTQLSVSGGTSQIQNSSPDSYFGLNRYAVSTPGKDNSMEAVGVSQVYFQRGSLNSSYGAGLGTPTESASLFSPYWHARMADTTEAVLISRERQGP